MSVTGTAAVTPGTARNAVTTGSAIPAAAPGTTAASAAMRARAALSVALARVSKAARVAPAMPTVTRIGAAVAAVRRTAVRAPCMASTPAGPRNAATGAVSNDTSGGMSSGANMAKAMMSSIAALMASATVESDSTLGNTASIGTTPAIAASPTTQRASVIVRRSTAASRSASTGRTLPARRAASHAPVSATSNPAPNAAATGQKMTCAVKFAGAKPVSTSQRANRGAAAVPNAEPAAAATHTDHKRLAEHQPAHLARRGSSGPQQPELAAPGRDRVRERAGHHEDGHEPGHAATAPKAARSAR